MRIPVVLSLSISLSLSLSLSQTCKNVLLKDTVSKQLTVLTQEWKQGNTVEVFFPLALHASVVQDNRSAFNTTMAWMYGPIVLAGVGNASNSVYFQPEGGDGAKPDAFIKRTATTADDAEDDAEEKEEKELRFVASGKDMIGGPIAMEMMPL